MVDVGCKFALNEMRRYGAFQSEVNSFPTINCIPPPTVSTRPVPLFPHGRSFDAACLFVLSLSFDPRLRHFHPSFSPSLPPRHIVLTYIVPPNNICSKGCEITDSVESPPRSIVPDFPFFRVKILTKYRRFVRDRSIESRGVFMKWYKPEARRCTVQESCAASRCKRRCLPRPQPIVSRHGKAPRGL